MKVIFLKTTDDGQEELPGFVHLTGMGVVEFIGLPEWLADTLDDGIVGRREDNPVFPDEGRSFMDELPYEFNGSYLRAKIIDG